jgi:hypothetical protein
VKIRNIKALVPFKGYVVTGINFEEIGAQINLDIDKRSGPRCPHGEERLPRNKTGRRAVMDSPCLMVPFHSHPAGRLNWERKSGLVLR